MFNLIPTELDEYKIYADWLEDQGIILTAAVRKGVLPLDVEYEEEALCYGDGCLLNEPNLYGDGCLLNEPNLYGGGCFSGRGSIYLPGKGWSGI